MRAKRGLRLRITRIITVCALIHLMASSLLAVPAAPNSAVILGSVSEFTISAKTHLGTDTGAPLYRIALDVRAVLSSSGPARTTGIVGQSIMLYTRQALSPDIYGKTVEVEVSYVGDERGGLYWIGKLEVRGDK